MGVETTCFDSFRKEPIVTNNEFGVCEIEIAEDVVLSTPSATHLTALPHPPHSFETQPTSLGEEGRSRNYNDSCK